MWWCAGEGACNGEGREGGEGWYIGKVKGGKGGEGAGQGRNEVEHRQLRSASTVVW